MCTHSYEGFQSHGGTPSHHLFFQRIFPERNHYLGYPNLLGNPHIYNQKKDLIGGLVAMNFMFPEILGCENHPNWLIFFRGVARNHQPAHDPLFLSAEQLAEPLGAPPPLQLSLGSTKVMWMNSATWPWRHRWICWLRLGYDTFGYDIFFWCFFNVIFWGHVQTFCLWML